MKKIYQFIWLILPLSLTAQVNPKLQIKLDQQANEIESRVIQWRRDFHQHPELGNREFKTGAKLAEHLKWTLCQLPNAMALRLHQKRRPFLMDRRQA
jgi:hypothetical protein